MKLADLQAQGIEVMSGAAIATLPLSRHTAQGSAAGAAYIQTAGLTRAHRETVLGQRPTVHGQTVSLLLFGTAKGRPERH